MKNKVNLIGNVGQDPDIKHLEGGNVVANFSLAPSEKFKTKSGEKKENTEWHNIVIWGKLAEVVEKWVTKGSRLDLEGKITTRSWEQDGVTKYKTEIVCNQMIMLSAPANSAPAPGKAPAKPAGSNTYQDAVAAGQMDEDDDLPF